MTAVRMLGAAIVISLMVLAGNLLAVAQSEADAPFVDGPIGTAVRQAPDPSKPIDVNGAP